MSKRQAVTATAYDKSGRIISIGHNSYINTHPLQAKYARKSGNPDAIYIHAELDAIIRARGRPIHRLFVSRHNNDGHHAMAKPCKACQLAIRDFSIKHVEWTE